jgi:GNAT superfamily N-acetyltransferase
MINKCRLIRVQREVDWKAYHAIRQCELWDKKGLSGYDPHHPDEYRPDHYSFLLKHDDEAIGTLRLDVINEDMGILRLGAISEPYQGQGYGRILFRLVENQARLYRLKYLVLNANAETVGFYKKDGWNEFIWDKAGAYDIDPSGVQMSKNL